MASLSNNKIKDTYQSLVKFNDNGNITTSAKRLTDGFGNNSPFFVSTTQIGIGVTPTLGYDLHVNSNAKIGGNLLVSGNLTVSGTLTYLDVEDLATEDPLIKLARNNVGNSLDIGFFGKYVESTVTKYKGLFNDADDNKWKLFIGTSDEPTTIVNTSGTGYTVGTLVANLEGNVTGGTISGTTGNFINQVTIPETPTADGHAASKKYVDDSVPTEVNSAKSLQIDVKNVHGATLAKGTVVHAEPTGTLSGNVIEVVAADANTGRMPAIGVLNEALLDDGEGKAVMFGTVQGIDTSGFSVGDELYVSATAGQFTATKPIATTEEVQKIAIVVKSHASNGLIKVFGAGRANDVPNRVDRDMNFTDDSELTFGDSSDLKIYHSTNNIVRINSGDLIFNSFVTDGDIKFQLDNGSGSLTEYLRLDGGSENIVASKTISGNVTGNAYLNTIAYQGGEGTELDNSAYNADGIGTTFRWIENNSSTTGTTWKKVADVVINDFGFKSGVQMEVRVLQPNTYWGDNASLNTIYYSIAFRGDESDTGPFYDDALVYGPDANLIRVYKTSTHNYELQARSNDNNEDLVVECNITSKNGAKVTPTTTYTDGTITGGTAYTASPNNLNVTKFAGNVEFEGAVFDDAEVEDLRVNEYLYFGSGATSGYGPHIQHSDSGGTGNGMTITVESDLQVWGVTGNGGEQNQGLYVAGGVAKLYDLNGVVLETVLGGVDITGDLDVSGTITGDVTGDLTGNVTGDLTGSVTGAASLNVLKAGDTMTGNLKLNDDVKVSFGNDSNLNIDYNSAGDFGRISNTSGHLYIQNTADNKDIIFRSDDGSGGNAEYFRVDGSTSRVVYGRSIQVADNVSIFLGNSATNTDGYLKWDSTASQIFIGGTVKFLDNVISVGNIETTNGVLNIYKSSETTSSATGTTLLSLTNNVGGDLSQQKTFIDFNLLDNNDNEYPQVRIGAEVGQNGDANSQTLEGSGAFLVYTNNATGNGPGTPTGLAENLRVDFSGTTTTPKIRLTSTSDASITSTEHGFQVGSTDSANIIADGNEIMARNNSAVSELNLNPDGGDVTFGNNVNASTMSGSGNLNVYGHTTTTELNLPSSGMVDWANGDARIVEGLVNNFSLSFQTYDGTNVTTALRLDGDNTATFAGNIILGDTPQIQLGTNNDAQIDHTGSHLFIDNSVGNSYLRNTSTGSIILRNGTGGDIQFDNEFAGNILFNTSNIERMRIDSNGQVIINNGDVTIGQDGTYGSDYGMIAFSGTTNGEPRIFGGLTNKNLYLTSGTGGNLNFRTNGTSANKMVIDNDGATTITTDGTVDATTLTLTQTGGIAIDEALGYLNFYSNDPSTSSTGGVGGIAVRAETTFNTSYTPSYMSFYTHDTTTNDGTVRGNVTERMRIDSSGRVGIGSTPSRKLDVRDSSNTQNTILAYNQGASFTGTVYEAITDRTANAAFNLMNLKASTSSKFLVRGDGNVGIGTASPGAKLDISESNNGILLSRIYNTSTASASGSALRIASSSTTHANSNTIQFSDASYYTATISGDRTQGLVFRTSATGSNPITIPERMRITSEGKVGIGITNPAYALHAYHPTTNVVARFESGDSYAWIDLHDSNSSTYGVLLGADGTDFVIAPNNTQVVRVKSNGRVGINNSNPSYNLDIAGTGPRIRVQENSSNTTSTMVEVENSDGRGAMLGIGGAGRSDILTNRGFINSQSEADGLAIGTEGADPIIFYNNGVATSNERMRLTSSGLLGIGGGSTVDADIHIKRTGDASIIIEADSDNVGENDNPTLFLRQDGAIIGARFGINGDANNQFTGAIGNAGYILTSGAFQICAGNHSATFSDGTMMIDGGATTSSYKLDIRNATSNGINITGTGAYVRWNAGDMQIRNGGGYKMSFDTWNGTTLNEKMTISGGGVVHANTRVDIGTQTWTGYGSNPIAKLNVEVSNDNAINIYNTSEGYAGFNFIDSQSNGSQYGTISWSSGSGNPMKISNMGVDAIYITSQGNVGIKKTSSISYALDVTGTIRASSDVIAFSDRRVKKDIVTVKNALNKVNNLRGVTYKRSDVPDNKTKLGVIAQEVLEVLPEVVEKDDKGLYSVAYGNMAGVFIEAIKELKAEVDSLKLEIKQLKNK